MFSFFDDKSVANQGLKLIPKDEFIEKLREANKKGWILNTRKGNDGSVGKVLEDFLGIPENNLPIPNGAEWELKSQRKNTSSLLTLCHMEPSPRAMKFVPEILLPYYGWPHDKAGNKYPATEMSFRCTVGASKYTDRGFKLFVNRESQRVEFTWDSSQCSPRHAEWINHLKDTVGLGPFSTNPYWGFNDLFAKTGTKLINCFFVLADVKKENGEEYFHYNEAYMLQDFNVKSFIDAIEEGYVCVDFDARTGHNHGTKFRIPSKDIIKLYGKVTKIIG